MAQKEIGASQAEKIWGNSQVLCGGRFVSGPDCRSAAATTLMVLVPSVVWQAVVGTWFAERYTAFFSVLGGVLAVASLVLLLATAFSDPGIMPRQKEYTEQYDPATGTARSKQPTRYYDVVLRGHPMKLKYCVTCNIYRPPRCTHCSVCENCVERFDHHCPWIGNCVGKRNYWLFYSFVSFTGALNAYSLATAVGLLTIRGQEIALEEGFDSTRALGETLKQEPWTAALAIYSTMLVWFTVGLCLYHSFLISTNQTTYEQIKGLYSSGANPFHRGSVSANCSDVLCAPVRPRLFDGRTGQMRWPKCTWDAMRERLCSGSDLHSVAPTIDRSASTPGAPRALGTHLAPSPVSPPAGGVQEDNASNTTGSRAASPVGGGWENTTAADGTPATASGSPQVARSADRLSAQSEQRQRPRKAPKLGAQSSAL